MTAFDADYARLTANHAISLAALDPPKWARMLLAAWDALDGLAATMKAQTNDYKRDLDRLDEVEMESQARKLLCEEYAAEVARLSAIERHLQDMEKALWPFARDAEAFDNAERTYGDCPVFERLSDGHHWRFTIADVRRARAALPARLTEIYGTKADRDGDRSHYAPDARRENQ